MSAWIIRQKLFIKINRRNNETNPGFLETSNRDHPREAGKYVQGMSDELQTVFPKYMQQKLKEGIPENLVV